MSNSILVRSPFTADDPRLPRYEFTAAELAILDLPGLTGWWEPGEGLEREGGFRLQARHAPLRAQPRDGLPPLVVTASHGRRALQTSYGDPRFATTDRGALRLPRGEYLGATGFTVVMAVRAPPASETGDRTGGIIWAAEGATAGTAIDSTIPRVNISGVTGAVNLFGGGQQIANPAPGFDARDGAWHIISARLDTAAGLLRLGIDGARSVGQQVEATTPVPIHARRPVIGRSTGNNASPFYGQWSGLMLFDTALANASLASVEAYLAGKFAATLV